MNSPNGTEASSTLGRLNRQIPSSVPSQATNGPTPCFATFFSTGILPSARRSKSESKRKIERHRISQDIKEFENRYQWTPRRMWGVAWRTGLVMAILGALLSVFFDRLVRCLAGI